MASTGLYLWLHGLMAAVLDKNNIRVITPGPVAEHACLIGRVTSSDPATWDLAEVKGWFVLEGISAPAVLPARSPDFASFVIENVSGVRYDQSAFVLTVPLPDAILPLRLTMLEVKPQPPATVAPFHNGTLPLLVVFQYSNVDLERVQIPGLWQPPALSDGPIHLHLYVEPDPRLSNNQLHDPQSDLDKLVELFPGTAKFNVPENTIRGCVALPPVPGIGGVLTDSSGAVIEQLDLWEWSNQCNQSARRPVALLTFPGGMCPTGFFVLKGVTWA